MTSSKIFANSYSSEIGVGRQEKGNKSQTMRVGFLFLLQPFLSLLMALKNYKADWSKNVIWAIVAFYGLTFAISTEATSDSVRYAQRLAEMYASGWNISEIIARMYVVGEFRDIYQPLMTFIVSRFTENYNILFAAFGFVLGYFYSRNIWILIEYFDKSLNRYSVFLLVVFSLIVTISSGINGVRMWTGAHVFIFGILQYLLLGKNVRGILIAASAILFHFSYIVPVVLLVGYYVVGNRLIIYYCIFVASFFINELDFEFGRQLASYLPLVFEDRTQMYIGEGRELRMLESAGSRSQPWFLVWNSILFNYTIFLLVSYLVIFKRNVIRESPYYSLFAVGILFYGVFNILGYYPSVGRFLNPSSMLLFGSFVLHMQSFNDKNFKKLVLFTSPALILFIILRIRSMMNSMSYLFVFGNPFIAPFMETDMGLYEFIRQFI